MAGDGCVRDGRASPQPTATRTNAAEKMYLIHPYTSDSEENPQLFLRLAVKITLFAKPSRYAAGDRETAAASHP